jgi:hypothetical protein
MLAQSFKSADELGITVAEQQALIEVLGMLERGELIDVGPHTECDNGFHMGTSGHGCGTPACIGGWAAYVMGLKQDDYLDRYDITQRDKNPALHELFWDETAIDTPALTSEAATALRSYLTTGDAKWHEAVA